MVWENKGAREGEAQELKRSNSELEVKNSQKYWRRYWTSHWTWEGRLKIFFKFLMLE